LACEMGQSEILMRLIVSCALFRKLSDKSTSDLENLR
jgi:hypothetical protein